MKQYLTPETLIMKAQLATLGLSDTISVSSLNPNVISLVDAMVAMQTIQPAHHKTLRRTMTKSVVNDNVNGGGPTYVVLTARLMNVIAHYCEGIYVKLLGHTLVKDHETHMSDIQTLILTSLAKLKGAECSYRDAAGPVINVYDIYTVMAKILYLEELPLESEYHKIDMCNQIYNDTLGKLISSLQELILTPAEVHPMRFVKLCQEYLLSNGYAPVTGIVDYFCDLGKTSNPYMYVVALNKVAYYSIIMSSDTHKNTEWFEEYVYLICDNMGIPMPMSDSYNDIIFTMFTLLKNDPVIGQTLDIVKECRESDVKPIVKMDALKCSAIVGALGSAAFRDIMTMPAVLGSDGIKRKHSVNIMEVMEVMYNLTSKISGKRKHPAAMFRIYVRAINALLNKK